MSYIKQLYKQPLAFIKSPIINFLKECIGPKSIIKKKKNHIIVYEILILLPSIYLKTPHMAKVKHGSYY